MQMRKDRLNEIIDIISTNPEDFSMRRWGIKGIAEMCGTTCCIGGLAINKWGSLDHIQLYGGSCLDTIVWEASAVLGLSNSQATRLFFPDNWPLDAKKAYRDWRVKSGRLSQEEVTMAIAQIRAIMAEEPDFEKSNTEELQELQLA